MSPPDDHKPPAEAVAPVGSRAATLAYGPVRSRHWEIWRHRIGQVLLALGWLLVLVHALAIANVGLGRLHFAMMTMAYGALLGPPLALLMILVRVPVRRLLAWLACALLFWAATVSACVNAWPVRIIFWFREADLRELAEDVRSGQAVLPERVGPLMVRGSWVTPDCVGLWTELAWTGNTGLLHWSAPAPDGKPPRYWVVWRLTNEWWFVLEE
jgi:hypothetical protein